VSLLGHIRVNVRDDAEVVYTTGVINSSLLSHVRVNIGDDSGIASGIMTSSSMMDLLRIDVGDVYSSGTYTESSGEMSLMRHLRVNIDDDWTVLSSISGALSFIDLLRVDISDDGAGSDSYDPPGIDNIVVGGSGIFNGTIVINGSLSITPTIINTNYSALPSDAVILVNNTQSAPLYVSLDTSPSIGQMLVIKDIGGNAWVYNIFVTSASHQIDGNSTFRFSNNYQSISLIFNGSQWNII